MATRKPKTSIYAANTQLIHEALDRIEAKLAQSNADAIDDGTDIAALEKRVDAMYQEMGRIDRDLHTKLQAHAQRIDKLQTHIDNQSTLIDANARILSERLELKQDRTQTADGYHIKQPVPDVSRWDLSTRKARDWQGNLKDMPKPSGTRIWVDADGQIELWDQRAHRTFSVVYGLQHRDSLNFEQATREIGSVLMHKLACEGKVRG